MTKLVMVFDTETTGKSDFKLAYDHPSQPNLIQLGYKVFHPKNREVIWEVGHLVDTTDFPEWNGIEEGAQNVHGISEEVVKEFGVSAEMSLKAFMKWAGRCNMFVAHNKQFDIMVMQCFAKRAGYNPDIFGPDATTFCTMQTTTAICKIPKEKGYGFKWPKLPEAYSRLVDERGFKGAHNALADVNPTAEIFWKLVDAGIVQLPKEVDNASAAS